MSGLRRRRIVLAAAGGAVLLLASCGGGDGGPDVEISILEPTDTGTHTQSGSDLALSGRVARASFVEVRLADGRSMPGYVTSFDGQGTWMADVYGLALGTNRLTVVADHDGTGRWTATARIDVVRTPG